MTNFLAFLTLVLAVKMPAGKKTYLYSFLLGLLADLLDGTPLGIFVAVFLILTLVVFWFKTYFRFNALTFLLFLVLSQIIIFYGSRLIA